MQEDWGTNAQAPVFSLFKTATPEEEAAKDGFVDSVVYNRWKKADRRKYARLKAERINNQIQQDKIQSLDEITSALESLCMLKDTEQQNPAIDQLVGQLQGMKIRASGSNR